MSKLTFIPLAQLADITMGQSPGSGLCNAIGKGLPFLQGCAEFGLHSPKTSAWCILPLKIAKAGSVLISVRAPVGTMNYADQDYCIGRGLGAFRAKPGVANTLFLKCAVEHGLAYLHKRSQGSTFPAVSTSDIQTLPIPRFSLEKQNKIAKLVTHIDETIEKSEILIEKYHQINTGLMQDIFSRGVLPTGDLRPKWEQAPELYKETAIGWIPKDWKIRDLEYFADVIDPQPDHRTPPESIDGIPYVGIGDFNRYHELNLSKCRKIIYSAYEKQSRRFEIDDGDIIYGKIGTIGHPKRLPRGGYAISANVILIKPRTVKDYIYFALNSSAFEKQVSSITNTTSQPALGIEKVRKIQIPAPSHSEATTIGRLAKSSSEKINLELRLLTKLRLQRHGLINDLLTENTPESLYTSAPIYA